MRSMQGDLSSSHNLTKGIQQKNHLQHINENIQNFNDASFNDINCNNFQDYDDEEDNEDEANQEDEEEEYYDEDQVSGLGANKESFFNGTTKLNQDSERSEIEAIRSHSHI